MGTRLKVVAPRYRFLAAGLAVLLLACTEAAPAPTASQDLPGVPAPTEVPRDGSTAPTPVPQEPADRSSQALIAQAVADGELDFATSLLYRAYAFFGDPRLPQQFAGEGSEEEDQGLFMLPGVMGDELPREIREQLEPFLAMPIDPVSVLHGPGAQASRVSLAVAANAQLSAQGGVVSCLPDQWGYRKASVPVVVWARCDTPRYSEDIARAIRIINEVWGPMTSLMGDPIWDPIPQLLVGDRYGIKFGDVVHIFLVHTSNCWDRSEPFCDGMPASALGYAYARDLMLTDGTRCPGYAVARRELEASLFRRVLIHEIFHLQQFAYNCLLAFNVGSGVTETKDLFWFYEASAAWATYHFERSLGQHASADSELGRVAPFQVTDVSLDSHFPFPHRYSAFIWPYFMVQEHGGAHGSPEVMASTWKALQGKTDRRGAMDAISGQVPFRDKFRDFAVRNINETLSEPDPLGTRYQQLDARFPELPPGGTKQRGKHRLEAREEKYEYFELTWALSAGYWRFDVTDTKIQQLVLNFSGLAPGDALAVDILLETRQDPPLAPLWERRKLATGETRLCRTRSGEDFLDIYLILSNHDLDQRSVSGTFTIEALEEPCAEGGGTITITRDRTGTYTSARNFPVSVSFTESATISFQLEPDEFAEDSFSTSDGSVTWSHSLLAIESMDGCSVVERSEGGGTYRISEHGGPTLTFGVDENFNLDPDAYLLVAGGPPDEYVDGDPSTHYHVSSTICAEELPLEEAGLSWWPYFPDGGMQSGKVAPGAKVISGSRQQTIEPMGGTGLPTIKTVTWEINLP